MNIFNHDHEVSALAKRVTATTEALIVERYYFFKNFSKERTLNKYDMKKIEHVITNNVTESSNHLCKQSFGMFLLQLSFAHNLVM